MSIATYFKNKNLIMKNYSKIRKMSLSDYNSGWSYKDDNKNTVADFNLLLYYAEAKHLDKLEIPDSVDILKVVDEVFIYDKEIVFPEDFKGFQVTDKECHFKFKNLKCSKLNFSRCKYLEKISEYAFDNLDLKYLSLPKYISVSAKAFYNCKVEKLDYYTFAEVKSGGLANMTLDSFETVQFDYNSTLEEESFGIKVKDVCIGVSNEYYTRELQSFLNSCRKYVCKGHRVKYTKEERKACLEFLSYYLDNPFLMDEDTVDTQEMSTLDMDININLKDIKLNTRGVMLAIHHYLFNKSCEIERENYLKQFLLCVSKLFWLSEDKELPRNVYLYNTSGNKGEYILLTSSSVTDKGIVNLYIDKSLENDFNSKFKVKKK